MEGFQWGFKQTKGIIFYCLPIVVKKVTTFTRKRDWQPRNAPRSSIVCVSFKYGVHLYCQETGKNQVL